MSRVLFIVFVVGPILALGFGLLVVSGGRPVCDTQPKAGALGSICGFENPADVEAVSSANVVLVTERRRQADGSGGTIAAVTVDSRGRFQMPRRLWPTGEIGDNGTAQGKSTVGERKCNTPPNALTFNPQGLTSAPSDRRGVVRVAVASHGEREAIELFDLIGSGDKAVLSWRGCVRLPKNTTANDVALLSNGSMIAANDVAIAEGWKGLYYRFSNWFGSTQGHLAMWRAGGKEWETIAGTVGPTANGVVVSHDGTRVFYSEAQTGEIKRLSRVKKESRRLRESVQIGGRPDNLVWTRRGTLLAVTHVNSTRSWLCKLGSLPCRSDWAVFEIDPEHLNAQRLLRHDGQVVGEVTAAVELYGRYFFSAAYDDRIGVWTPPIKSASR